MNFQDIDRGLSAGEALTKAIKVLLDKDPMLANRFPVLFQVHPSVSIPVRKLHRNLRGIGYEGLQVVENPYLLPNEWVISPDYRKM